VYSVSLPKHKASRKKLLDFPPPVAYNKSPSLPYQLAVLIIKDILLAPPGARHMHRSGSRLTISSTHADSSALKFEESRRMKLFNDWLLSLLFYSGNKTSTFIAPTRFWVKLAFVLNYMRKAFLSCLPQLMLQTGNYELIKTFSFSLSSESSRCECYRVHFLGWTATNRQLKDALRQTSGNPTLLPVARIPLWKTIRKQLLAKILT
jgi:hypothetical protein